ncbi:MAG: 50S ribosomal protein L4 [Bacteroidales bacterium]|nr:50S ribosomal protein L4 [Bacteroidales bacterium]MDZ4204458.1 50S ribosomal protein L4 [Bacteroidales bacterium]
MELEVFNVKGEKTNRTVTLNEEVFNVSPNDHAIYLDVKQYMANQRQGTHSSLEKSTVSGSTKKLKRQKGTGGARGGSVKNPLLRGGARIFGPHPRDYFFKLNKKLKKLARISALSYKAKENNIVVIEDFSFEAPKTKNITQLMSNFEVVGKKVLFVVPQSNPNLYLSSRNLPNTKVVLADSINTYDILNANSLFVFESSLNKITSILE